MKLLTALTLTTLAFILTFGCTPDNQITINGHFFGKPGKKVSLKRLSLKEGTVEIDTITTNEKGQFSFKVTPSDTTPTFYNVVVESSYVPILAKPGETLEISAVGNIYYNYTVEGSKGSKLVKEFNNLVRNTSLKLDSIIKIYDRTVEPQRQQQLGVEYQQEYNNLKRSAIKFIVQNNSSLASLMPLYQPYDRNRQQFLFAEVEDFVYFKMLRDSLQQYYPNSPYVQSLDNDVKQVETAHVEAAKFDSLIEHSIAENRKYPNIVMNNAKGEMSELAQFDGEVTLLCYTASEPVEQKTVNQELLKVYNKYESKGLKIYQVFLDRSKVQWLTTVSAMKIPWTTVCDELGANSPAVRTYNVTIIPSNFLFDKTGDMVGKNLSPKELDAKLSSIL